MRPQIRVFGDGQHVPNWPLGVTVEVLGRPKRGALELPFRSVDDPKHWRHRAKEMRDLLDELTDGEIRATILRLADEYDKLAARAEERARGNASKPSQATVRPR